MSAAIAPARATRLASLARACVPSGRTVVIAVPFVFLLVFFMLPFAAVLKISFADVQMSVPPYTSIAAFQDGMLRIALDFAHYRAVLTDPLYIGAYAYSVEVAALTTLLCLLIGYPACYLIARADPAWRNLSLIHISEPTRPY